MKNNDGSKFIFKALKKGAVISAILKSLKSKLILVNVINSELFATKKES